MELELNQRSGANVADSELSGAGDAANAAPKKGASPQPGNGKAIPVAATYIESVDGVVQLPPGTRLDAIKLSGTDLIVTLPDGQVMVIVDGALRIPQIKFGPINIPAQTIAALIAGQEPQPAAGAPQSSGGNFEQTPGDIGDPFALGDLLPPTEFGFAQPQEEEFVPNAVDNEPEILIITPDQPLGSATATATVSEAGLPPRGLEPAGSDPSSSSETVTGTIQITSIDAPSTVTVNGTAITAVGQTVTTPLGVLTITSIAPGAIGYSYTLVDNSTNPTAAEVLTITVTDKDGDVATGTLTLNISDDSPTARADVENIAPKTYSAQTGNVITGAGTSSGNAGADTQGADGATVTGIRLSSGTNFAAPGAAIEGQYGKLLINADGSYSYLRNAGTPGGVADVFTYQLTDGDGDTSTATLTFNIGDSPAAVFTPSDGDDGTVVYEAGLPERGNEPGGSREGDDSNLTSGIIYFEVPDGPAIIAINGVKVTGEGQEITLPTGTLFVSSINPDSIEYFFILGDNIVGEPGGQPITITVTDQDGDIASSTFTIEIVDDVPTAVADTDRLAAGNYGPATGNVITDAENDGGKDTPGADGAAVSLVKGVGAAATAGTAVNGQYGVLTLNADGSYSYVRNPGTPGGVSDVFTYTLRDGDGDTSNATLTIQIGDANVSVRLPSGSDAGQNVSEAGLPAGSAPASGSATTSGSFAVSITDGPGKVSINGADITAVGQTFTGAYGTLTITSISPTSIGYSYKLTTASNGETNTDAFNVKVTDQDGDAATGTLRINITDDQPTAADDEDFINAGSSTAADGNVLTGTGGSDANTSDGAADVQGADRATVTRITFDGDSGFVGGLTQGAYGTLKIAADGSYSYTLNNAHPDIISLDGTETLTEVFEYTITDADGDESTATLTVTIRGKDDVVTLSGVNPEGPEVTVSEANLAGGSAPNDGALTQTGSFTFDAPDGLAKVLVGGEELFDGDIVPGLTITTDKGILTITDFVAVYDGNGEVIGGTISYSYELTDNSLLHTGANGGALTETFAITVVDSDGSTATSALEVRIIDDNPLARHDTGDAGEGETLEVDADAGVLANDTLGADEASILGVRAIGRDPASPANGGVGIAITGLYGTLTLAADGSYRYVSNPNAVVPPGANDVFVYTLRDGDGDSSTATLTIHVSDSGLTATSETAQVNEAALPDGSDPESDAESVSGDLGANVSGGTGPFTFALIGNGVGNNGVLTLNPDGTFTYVLTNAVTSGVANNGTNTVPAVETFTYSVTDAFGNTTQNSITIDVVDDKPTARLDEGDVGEGDTLEVDADAGVLANDTLGADEATILGVRAIGSDPAGPANGGVGTAITGLYGTLTVAADGSYRYVSNPNAVVPRGANDVFVYTLRDGDGDTSTTTLTIHVSDSGLAATRAVAQVNEAALPDGSNPDSGAESVSGDLDANVSGGTGPYTFVLVGNGVGNNGVLTLNSDGTYTYILTNALTGNTANNGANTVPALETFTYSVTDAFGNTTQNSIVIDLVDDVPIARADPLINVAEDALAISGNLLTNDSEGADGATVTSVTIGSTVVNVASSGTTSFTNANGTYTFEADGSWTFDPVSQSSAAPVNADFSYTITDGDGDKSTAQQQIRVNDGANPRVSNPITLTLDDENLETGSNPWTNPPVSTNGQIVFTQGSDAIISIVFGGVGGLGGSLVWTRESDTQIIGWDADIPVVVLDLTVSGNTAKVTATLQYNYSHHPDTTADDLANLGSALVVATDSDGDTAVGTVNVAVSDDVPTISVAGPATGLLTVDETNLAANATANFASLFDVQMGADAPGTVTYAFEVTTATGLFDVATGSKIILQAIGNVVEGRLQDAPSVVAFRLTIAPNGQATLDQIRAVRHPDGSNPDDSVSLSSTAIRLIATVTDSDGDKATTTAMVGGALVFRDDGPSIDATATDANTLLLTTQDADTRGAAFDVATANLSSAFSVASSSFGADGPAGSGQVLWSYALALGSNATNTGLTSDGVSVTLALVAGEVIGSANGVPIFSVSVNATTGIVTLTQFAEIDHPLPGVSSNYAAQLVELAANLIELRGTATIFDKDGDSISDTSTVDLGGNIRFADDGPSVSVGSSSTELVVDESNLYVNATADLSGLFATTLDYGADGAGSVTYELGVTAGPSGLIDSLTGEAIILSIVNGIVYGRTSTHEAFRISVGPGGVITFDQSRAVMHTPDSGPDQTVFLAGTNLITLTAIVTDGDGDTTSATADITGRFGIKDDAPVAVNDDDNLSRDGQTFADGNVLTALGGTDDNGTDGVADIPGADGGLQVSGVAYGVTVGTVGAALAGDFGSLTLNADGSYRYNLDINDPAVIALNANQTLTETFQYTVRDADGDTATATITITITGANDFPIARADTNWVLDGASGSDPSATGNVLQDIAHPGAPSGSFADVADSDPDLEPITVTTAGTYNGLYGTLVIAANGAYTYTLNEDLPAVNALDTGQTLTETFAYSISDGLLSVNSALTITIFGTNDAPTIGTTTARISEEGLPGANADTAPNATLDTTNSTMFSGTLAIADVDAGETLTATLGNPGAVLTAGGVPVTWSGVGTGTLIGSVGSTEVIRVTLASNGSYTVTLSKAVDHPTINLEDLKEFHVPVSVSDGTVTTTNATAIKVVIEDDAPTATGETGSSAQLTQDVNTLFILDFSDSIDGGELNTMLNAVKGALTQLDNAASAGLNIKFVIFSSGSFASPSFTTAAAANAYLDSLNPLAGGVRPDTIGLNTNYTAAIQTALANWSAVPGASNQVFFLSDGNPNQSTQTQVVGIPPQLVTLNSLLAPTATAWNNYIDSNNVNVTAIGVNNDPLSPLNIQRLRDVDVNDAPNNAPILVNDFQALVATLLSVIVPAAVGGDLDANDSYGADGGRILSITVGTVTYTWDGATTISVSSGGSISGTTLSVTTPMNGTLTLNFANGQYNYQPPSPITVTATENFGYKLVDKDGDTATATLSVTITAAAPPIAVDLDGDGVEFVSNAAGVLFDYNGDGVAETTAWVGADDGLLAIDKNGDGKINNGSEIVFGQGSMTDLQGLAIAYDSNADGKLDASDAEFAKFGIWQDANSNGVTDAGEFKSLTELGITSIALVSDNRGYTAADGQVVVRGEASFTRADGSTGKVADAAFATNFANDNQRAAAASVPGLTGLSAAMIAASLIAGTEVAAKVSDNPAFGDELLLDTAFSASIQDGAKPTVEKVEALDASLDRLGDSVETRQIDLLSDHKHISEHARDNFGPTDALETPKTAPAFTKLIDQSDIDLTHSTSSGDHSAPGVDQAQILLAQQPLGGGTMPDAIKSIVTDAMEGREVDLDALLGPSGGPENPLPQSPLIDAGDGFFGEGNAMAFNNLIMPDLTEQHVMVQLEQAAATGHA